AIDNLGTLAANTLLASNFNELVNSGRIESTTASYQGELLDNLANGLLITAGTGANVRLDVTQLTNHGVAHSTSTDLAGTGSLHDRGQAMPAGSGDLVRGTQGTIDHDAGQIASAGVATIQASLHGAGSALAAQGMQHGGEDVVVNQNEL